MKFGLDEYAHLNSPLHRWDARYKLVGLLTLMIAFSVIQQTWLLPVMITVTGGLYLLSELPVSYLVSRLKLPGYFLLSLAIILPLTTGQTILATWGPVSLRQEGLLNLMVIASRFCCIITLSLVLFGTAPFLTSLKAMRAIGLPLILADMLLLTYRYLFEINNQLVTMRTAIRLRGFQGHRLNRRTLSTLAALVGSLLVQSYDQSERVYQAMVLRGYGQATLSENMFQTRPLDIGWTMGLIVMAGGFIAGEIWWG